jgi:hypothetical protein
MRHVELFSLGADRAAVCKQGAIRLPDTMQDLKVKTIRGGLARLSEARVLSCVWGSWSLTRLLGSKDFSWRGHGFRGRGHGFRGGLTLFRDHGDCEQLHCHLEPVGSGKLRNIAGMVNPALPCSGY